MASESDDVIIGVDVCEDRLDVFERHSELAYSISNDAAVIKSRLDGLPGRVKLALEPTNRYSAPAHPVPRLPHSAPCRAPVGEDLRVGHECASGGATDLQVFLVSAAEIIDASAWLQLDDPGRKARHEFAIV